MHPDLLAKHSRYGNVVVVTICTTCFNIKKLDTSHSVFVMLHRLLTTVFVLCEVRTTHTTLQDTSNRTISCLPVTADTWVRPRVSPCEICDGRRGNGTDFSGIRPHQCYTYDTDKRPKPGILLGKQYPFRNRGTVYQTAFAPSVCTWSDT